MLIESIYIVMNNPLNTQIGGSHYESSFQPVELFALLNFNSFQANVFKYAFRHKNKNGLEDLKKALHYVELAIELNPKNFVPMSYFTNIIQRFWELNGSGYLFQSLSVYICLQWWDDAKKVVEDMVDEMSKAIEAVKQDGWLLDLVKEQTPELCLSAVKEDGFALQFVKEQTPEICLAAVKCYGRALRFVKNKTEAICLEAVKQNGCALEFVEDQTEAICIEAAKEDAYALKFVKKQTEEICLNTVKQDGFALQFVKEQTEAICREAVKQNKLALNYVNDEFKHLFD